ncbi:MAG: trans-2-enoyl-CoA reductase [Cellvibrionales bacterium TMED49]|nr:enoyl-[acyl-carrier-protein] reductase FabV [Porticoccaceae bacterium]OUU37001.1 MAG: trans-2-enoyl-CoA reductase [Cellvibrionales bacterium TMED49]
MIVEPRVRGFMCVTSHPAGCARNVKDQKSFTEFGSKIDGPKRVLIIGASSGYGLAARISAAFGANAATIGVFFEKVGTEKKTASAGWYNSVEFHHQAEISGVYAKSINGDAFSTAIKDRTIEAIKSDLGQVDLVIYSLAAPRREHPVTGVIHQSVLKPIGKDVCMLGIDVQKGKLQTSRIRAASDKEISDTVSVMGGEDWMLWIQALQEANVLATGIKTTAFTYIGEKITWDIYWHGTIGEAKRDLDLKALTIRKRLQSIGGDARVSVLKAVVTQASAAIPIMPLYLSILFREMKRKGTHEGCIEQICRLFKECLYTDSPRIDGSGRFRVDDLELQPQIQNAVSQSWSTAKDENLSDVADLPGYRDEFLKLFGFHVKGVDYSKSVEIQLPIEKLF